MYDLDLFFSSPEKKSKKTQFQCYGIDLGTTNSIVAEIVWRPGGKPSCRILEIDQATQQGQYTSPLIPSVVAILPDDQVWVGEGAKRLRTRPQEAGFLFEKNLFYETKNDMGLRKSYYRAPEPFNHASKIAGHILRFLKDSAERDLERKLDDYERDTLYPIATQKIEIDLDDGVKVNSELLTWYSSYTIIFCSKLSYGVKTQLEYIHG